MKVLGVDPGIHGGLAIINISEIADASVVAVNIIDIPVIGTAAKERVDVAAIRDWMSVYTIHHVYIERAQAMPRQGASSGFKYGRAVGAIESLIALQAIPLTIVEPSMWKKHFRLPGKDKEAARQRALQLFPKAREFFARKKDHGRAEAALIALYGANTGGTK